MNSSTTSNRRKRNTIHITAQTGEAEKLFLHFRDVAFNIPGIKFEMASIHQRFGGRGGVDRKKYYPLVLRDKHLDVVFLYGKNEPIPTPIMVKILKLAGFDKPDVFSALEKNPHIDVLIWGDGITQY